MGKSAHASTSARSVAHNDDMPNPTGAPARRRGRDILGCLTCRVRRKKCPDPEGNNNSRCSACVRNSLNCLGYPGPSPPWAGRSQRRLRECALRNLSFYKQRDLPLELTIEEVQILNALEWQSHLHAPDREREPDCPRPDFCGTPLSLDQLIRHGLLQVQNYEPSQTLQYEPEGLKKRKTATSPPTTSEGSNDAQRLSHISQSGPSSSGADGGFLYLDCVAPQPPISPDLISNTHSHTSIAQYSARSLPPPTRQSLTDSVDTPVSGLIRRRGALTTDTLNPMEHISPSDLSFWPHDYQETFGRHPSGPHSRVISDEPLHANLSIASPSDRPAGTGVNPRSEFRLPPIRRQQEIGMEGLPTFSHIYQPQPMSATRIRTMRDEVLMRSASPRTRPPTESSDVSASPSPSPSVQSGVSGTQDFQQEDSDIYYATAPGIFAPERTWSLNPSPTRQQSSSLAYGSIALFPSNYVHEGIAPHEQFPSPISASYIGTSSGYSIQQPIPRPRSPATQDNDERSPSPRQLRLLSFQPFPSGELSE